METGSPYGGRESGGRAAPPPSSDGEGILRVLVATDTHVGHRERDPVRSDDSFEVFDEILRLAHAVEADLVLHGGDLFDHHKPSRSTLYRTMSLLRKHCIDGASQGGARAFSITNDGESRSRIFKFGRAAFENTNVQVQLPVLGIHGNHDDPGDEAFLASMDVLEAANLVTYFGWTADLEKIAVQPVLLKKGETRVALYGLGHIRDERLHRMFEAGKVHFLHPPAAAQTGEDGFRPPAPRPPQGPSGGGAPPASPWDALEAPAGGGRPRAYGASPAASADAAEPPASGAPSPYFNIMVIHQNRYKGAFGGIPNRNCIHETMIPAMMDVVIWGHEHDCVPEPTQCMQADFYVIQPGSSIATSLTRGEALPKHVVLLEVKGDNFRSTFIPLRTVRPIIYQEIAAPADGTSEAALLDFLAKEVEALVEDAGHCWQEHLRAWRSKLETVVWPTLQLPRERLAEYVAWFGARKSELGAGGASGGAGASGDGGAGAAGGRGAAAGGGAGGAGGGGGAAAAGGAGGAGGGGGGPPTFPPLRRGLAPAWTSGPASAAAAAGASDAPAPGAHPLPLVRLRVECASQPPVAVSAQRFGARFVGRVANPDSLVSWYRPRRRPGAAAAAGAIREGEATVLELVDAAGGTADPGGGGVKIQDLICKYIDESKQSMEILAEPELNIAVQDFVHRSETGAIDRLVTRALAQARNSVKQLGLPFETAEQIREAVVAKTMRARQALIDETTAAAGAAGGGAGDEGEVKMDDLTPAAEAENAPPHPGGGVRPGGAARAPPPPAGRRTAAASRVTPPGPPAPPGRPAPCFADTFSEAGGDDGGFGFAAGSALFSPGDSEASEDGFYADLPAPAGGPALPGGGPGRGKRATASAAGGRKRPPAAAAAAGAAAGAAAAAAGGAGRPSAAKKTRNALPVAPAGRSTTASIFARVVSQSTQPRPGPHACAVPAAPATPGRVSPAESAADAAETPLRTMALQPPLGEFFLTSGRQGGEGEEEDDGDDFLSRLGIQ